MPQQEGGENAQAFAQNITALMQQLIQSIQVGDYRTHRVEFEQNFQTYTSSLVELTRERNIKPLLLDEEKRIVLDRREVKGGLFRRSDIPAGFYSLECSYGIYFSFRPFYDDREDMKHQNYTREILNRVFSSGRSFSGPGLIRPRAILEISPYNKGHAEYSRRLEASDLLNMTVISKNPDGSVIRLIDMFFEGTQRLMRQVSNIVSSQNIVMQQAAPRMLVERLVSEAVNPSATAPALTVNDVQAIVDMAIAKHPIVLKLEKQGISETKLREIVEVMIEEHQPARQPLSSQRSQLSDQEIHKEIQKIAGDNPQIRRLLEDFVGQKVKNARNPERVFKAFVKVVAGFVPGAQGIVAIVEALDDLFGK